MAFTKENAKYWGRIAGSTPKTRVLVTQHIITELNEKGPKGVLRVQKLAKALVDLGCDGDIQAIKEIIDRVEGKAVQINENHNRNYSVGELSDDELRDIIAEGRSDGSGGGDFEAPGDKAKLN